jgi:hypothetical protein
MIFNKHIDDTGQIGLSSLFFFLFIHWLWAAWGQLSFHFEKHSSRFGRIHQVREHTLLKSRRARLKVPLKIGCELRGPITIDDTPDVQAKIAKGVDHVGDGRHDDVAFLAVPDVLAKRAYRCPK